MTVYLVGAGPGDPKLITVRGQELLQSAQAVVYDRLANPQLLNLVSENAEKISAGKGPGSVDMNQDEINQTLVDLGKKYECVVRLKGGDPFVFGRGGEEAAFLKEHEINFEVIPGITSAISAPAYAGIPVTHRGVATNFTVVTGHEDPTKETEQVKWKELASIDGTIAILMGVANRSTISQALILGGKDKKTPVAIIRNGTTPHQEVSLTTLDELGDVEAKNPSVIVVGNVASMSLDWFTSRPLFGKKIVVTRAREQQSQIVEKLEILGAQVIQAPTIEIEPIAFEVPEIGDVSYMIFTSANGVHITLSSLFELGIDVRYFAHSSIAAIGDATAEALKQYGLIADIVPSRFVAEELVEMFPDVHMRSTEELKEESPKVLCFKARETRDVLEIGLIDKGYEVNSVDVYDTKISSANEEVIESVRSADAITFASSSTVENAVELFGRECISKIPIKVSIGPITSETMRNLSLEKNVEADPHTIDGIIEALLKAVY